MMIVVLQNVVCSIYVGNGCGIYCYRSRQKYYTKSTVTLKLIFEILFIRSILNIDNNFVIVKNS